MAQLTPIRGFVDTPVSKAICICSVVSALALSILDAKYLVAFSLVPSIFDYHQYWRLATFQLAVVKESDLLLTIVLWFFLKLLERHFGSRKYFSLIFVFALYNAIISVLCLMLGREVYQLFTGRPSASTLNEIASGPLGVISSLYICYGAYIPPSYLFDLVISESHFTGIFAKLFSSKVTLTNQFPVYITYTLLIFNNGFKSLLPCLVGCFVGKLYVSDLLIGSKKWIVPDFIYSGLVHPSSSMRQLCVYFQRLSSRQVSISDDGAGRLPLEVSSRSVSPQAPLVSPSPQAL